MYGLFKTFGIAQPNVAQVSAHSINVRTTDGNFNLKEYIDVQEARTEWMAERLPRMLDLVHQGGARERPKSTMRSYCLQEKEAISCQAKMRWADWDGHTWFSIEHDGLGVGLAEDTDPTEAALEITSWV